MLFIKINDFFIKEDFYSIYNQKHEEIQKAIYDKKININKAKEYFIHLVMKNFTEKHKEFFTYEKSN